MLALLYYTVFTPVGLLMRLFGYDPLCRQLDRAAVQDGQHAGQRQADRVHAVVRGLAIGDGRGAEELGLGAQLHVHLEPDHDLVVRVGGLAHADSGGHAVW